MELYGIYPTDHPFIDSVMMNDAVMQLFHPDEYAAMRKLGRSTTFAEHEEEEEEEDGKDHGKQVYHTVSKIYLSKYNSNCFILLFFVD